MKRFEKYIHFFHLGYDKKYKNIIITAFIGRN